MCDPLSIWEPNIKISMWELEILLHKKRLQLLHDRYLIGYFFLSFFPVTKGRRGLWNIKELNQFSRRKWRWSEWLIELSVPLKQSRILSFFFNPQQQPHFFSLHARFGHQQLAEGALPYTSLTGRKYITLQPRAPASTKPQICKRSSLADVRSGDFALRLRGIGCALHPPHFCESSKTKFKVIPSLRKQEEEEDV